jgi:hypothetical protein
MLCALCKTRHADKKNTHFLTDGIIRSCLNLDGSSEREKGFYFDLSNNNAYVEFNFQRGTAVDKLEQSLGRHVTEEEINKAKAIPFSVDYVFCNTCEQLFTTIEGKFISEILPSFRNANLTAADSVTIADKKSLRLFFYLQVWRLGVCENKFSLTASVAEDLRLIIINSTTVTENEIKHYPLTITYLETLGDLREFTTNYVGFTTEKNPYLIFLNDFVIQFYETYDAVRFFDYYGLNKENTFDNFINYQEDIFTIEIFHNTNRKKFLSDTVTGEKIQQTLKFYRTCFSAMWLKIFGVTAPDHTVQEYMETIIGDDKFHILKYSKDTVVKLTHKFITDRI